MRITRWLLFSVWLPFYSLTAQHSVKPLLHQIDSAFQSSRQAHRVPGAVFAMVTPDSVLKLAGYGVANVESQTAVHPARTIFRVASVSKAVTATAIMRLVDRGVFDLDENVHTYLRTFQVDRRFEQPVTLRHLLTHSAGFDAEGPGRRTLNAEEMQPMPEHFARRMPSRVVPPGELILYSNYAGSLPGCIAEDFTGTPFDQWMNQELFTPLGMTRSGFVRTSLPEEDIAQGYFYRDGAYFPVPFEYTHTVSGSMLMTTAADMANLLQLHLKKGKWGKDRLLSPSTIELMHTLQFTVHPKLEGTTLGFYEMTANGKRILTHSGGFDGFMAQLYLLPEQEIAFFMAFNQRNGGAKVNQEIRQLIFDHYLAGLPESNEADPIFSTDLSRFEGTYQSTGIAQCNLNKLIAFPGKYQWTIEAATGDTLISWGQAFVPIGPLTFRPAKGDGGYMVFREDEAGNISHVTFGGLFTTHRRLAWYELKTVQLVILGFCGLVFLSAIFHYSWKLIKRRAHRSSSWCGLLTSGLNVLFFGLLLVAPHPNRYGIPIAFSLLLLLPLMALAISAGLPFAIRRIWREKRWSRWQGWHGVILLAAELIFLWFLSYWQLLGLKF